MPVQSDAQALIAALRSALERKCSTSATAASAATAVSTALLALCGAEEGFSDDELTNLRGGLDVCRQVFLGKIDPRFGMGQNVDQICAPPFEPRRQPAIELGQRLAPLRIGPGIDQVGNRLGPGKIDLARQKIGRAHV